jgi:MYXO-CTERM domain-containing protein
MNMKRGLVFTVCAAALVVGSSVAQAQNVQLSLNLRYTDPADPTEGGTWFLVAKTDDTDGIAAISAYISNITAGIAGSSYGPGTGAGSASYPATTAATIGAILNGGNPFKGTISGAENIVYGQDTANGPIVADVGQGAGMPGNTPVDPLRNPAWNNAAIIASGTFAGSRPAFVTAGANVTDANTLAGTTLNVGAQDAATTTTVRGDSMTLETAGTGLLGGDANRDGIVTGADFSALAAAFGTGTTWNQGDFNDSGSVTGADFSILAASFGLDSNPGPAIASVPEPAAAGLALFGLAGLSARRRRR